MQITVLLEAVLIVTLALAVLTDLRQQKIPNRLTFPAIALGLVLNTLLNGWHGLLFSVEGLAAASLSLALFLLAGAIGAGDIKLLWAVGALMGPHFAFGTLLATAILGGMQGLLTAARRGELTYTILNTFLGSHALATQGSITEIKGMGRTSRAGKMPYAPAIALGVAAVMLLRHWGAF